MDPFPISMTPPPHTLLHFSLAGSEEVVGVGGFRVDVFDNREHSQDVVGREERLMTLGTARRRRRS